MIKTMSYEKSGFTVDQYVKKLIWLEAVSDNMAANHMGWLIWHSYFDGESFTIKVTHVSE